MINCAKCSRRFSIGAACPKCGAVLASSVGRDLDAPTQGAEDERERWGWCFSSSAPDDSACRDHVLPFRRRAAT